MKKKLIVLHLVLFMSICCYAQKITFDSKYVKVGVLSNEWPSCMANNPNIRNLGNLNGNTFDQSQIGKQILDKLLLRDASGLHMDKLYEQALQNTTIEEYEAALMDPSAEVKDHLKREVAHQLLKNNYVIIFSTDEKEKKHWSVYHVEIDDNIINQAYLNWENPTNYDQINVPVKLVAKGKVPKKAKDENELIYRIAKKVPAFAVRGPVTNRFPFTAKMGRNLGMKKTSRIYIYRVKEDSNGEIYSKKVCTTRATEISEDNTRMYMISGSFPSTKKGDVAVLKDRHRSSVSLYGQGSFGDDARYGVQLQYDYLLDFSKNGIAHYAMLNVGANRYTKEKEGVWWNSESKEPVQPVLNHVEAKIGYGVGFNLLGRIEIVPYIMGGYQFSIVTNKGKLDDNLDTGLIYWDNSKEQWDGWQSMKWTGHGFVAYAGAKLNVNIWYPLQLSVGADYNYTFGENTLKPIRDRHELNRVNLYAGFRIHF